MNNMKVCTNKKLRHKVFSRWLLQGETGWNYENILGSGYCYAIMPALKEIYKDDPDSLNEAVKNHLQFFNCTPHMVNLILGVNLALEDELKSGGKDVIASIKTGLMGPLAGVGDSVFGVIYATVFGAIAGNMGLEGNIFGTLLWILANICLILPIRYFLFELGYKEGTNVVQSLGTKMKSLIDSANILGLTVVGALIPTVVNITVPAVFKMGEVEMKVQEDMLDAIMPKLLPAIFVLLVYWLLSRKNMTSTKTILIVMVFAIVCSFFGIF